MNSFKKGFTDGIPIGLGYLSVSLTVGIMAATAGFNIWQSVLISMTNLTSAGQFAGIAVMAEGGSLFEMALTQFIINLRYSLMSLSLTQKVDKSFTFPARLWFGAFHTDEIYAVAIGQKEKIGTKYFLGLTIAPYIGWTLGTFLGALLGNVLPPLIAGALSVALYGMFIAIVVPEMKKSWKTALIVLFAVALKFAFTYIPGLNKVTEGFAIIICAVAASVLGALFFPVGENKENENDSGSIKAPG